MADDQMKFTIEDVRMIFRNFQGREEQFNSAGDRNFTIVIPDTKMAEQMERDGWAVKFRDAREEGDPPEPQLKVKVSYRYRPPTVVIIDSQGNRTRLDENMIEILDWADIVTVDLICNGSHWAQPGGKSGVSAYLQSLYVTVQEDALERKYAASNEGDHK